MKQLFLLALIVTCTLCAQVNTGSITGLVTDPTDAVVVGATVTLINDETGVKLTTTTTSGGQYQFLALQRGRYTIEVTAPGFKKTERTGLELKVGDRLGVDLRLEVGCVTEVMNVVAESPLLVTTNANLGTVIENRKIMELPLPGRDPTRLFQTAPGVGGIKGDLSDLRLGGGRTRLVEYYVDGSPTTAVSDARATALPSIDAIEEVRVETNNLSAEYGRTSGGAINIQTRAGTNQYRGSLYNFAQSDVLNANDWNSNRRGFAKAGFQKYLFGGTLGGPVKIPGVYDGTNRTFFFFNYDGARQYEDAKLRTATMPTDLERAGDFSQTVNTAGQAVTIYDPATYNPATNRRSPFPGNRIPQARFDPVAQYMLQLWPRPNQPGDPGNGVNNYAGLASGESRRNDITARIDQTLGNNHRLYLRITRKSGASLPGYWAGPATAGVRPSWEIQAGSTLNYNWTARPTLLVSAQLGAAPRQFIYYPVFEGFDPTKIPFAANAKAELDPRFIPNMTFEKITGLGCTWCTTFLYDRYFFGNVSMTKIWSRHTMKIGYEQRRSYLNNSEAATPSGGASFSGAWTGLNQQAPFAQQGSGFASFLLGLPDNFSFTGNRFAWAVLFANHALFIQDDFKVNRRLTLNLGLRWEFEAPETERFDRIVFLDPAMDSGLKINPSYSWERDVVAAGRLPASAPVPQLNRPFLGMMGLTNSPVRASRNGTDPYYRNFGPRLGLAYQIDSKTVFRSGFGIMYSGYTGNASGTGSLAIHNYINSSGSAVITRDGGQTIAATLSNPVPNNYGLNPALTDWESIRDRYFGTYAYGYLLDHRPSYEISYNAGFQRTVRNAWLFEGSFVGNRGLRLFVGGNPSLATMPAEYLALGSLLEKQVPNPFYGMLPASNTSPLAQPTIAYKYLLNGHPHWPGGSLRSLQRATGRSQYFAGFFRVERRFKSGLSLDIAYTVSKLIEDTNAKTKSLYPLPQDGKSFRDIRGLSVQDIPQKFVATYLYALPLGRGQRWLRDTSTPARKLAEAVAGGWKLAGFSILQSGYPLQIIQNDNFTGGLNYGRLRPTLVGDYHSTTSVRDATGAPFPGKPTYLNKSAFAVTPRYQFGTVPHVLPDLRQPRYNQTDFAIMKEFYFGEGRFLQVRLESSNFFNHPVFELDDNARNIQRSEFGYFQSQLNSPRNMQFGARFVF
ncbi:MAG: carboxypeptidase regulatory-like domain-containing protein [Bryobacteraceae bacterium]